MSPDPDVPRPAREPYEPPVVERIRVVPSEMAVASCKGPTLGVTVSRACRASICKTVGS